MYGCAYSVVAVRMCLVFTVQSHFSPHVQGLEELQYHTDIACAEQAVGLVQLHVAEKLAIHLHFVYRRSFLADTQAVLSLHTLARQLHSCMGGAEKVELCTLQ